MSGEQNSPQGKKSRPGETFFYKAHTQGGYGDHVGIHLDGHDYERVGGIFSIAKEGEDVVFREEGEGFIHRNCSKEEAIAILKEALAWVEAL